MARTLTGLVLLLSSSIFLSGCGASSAGSGSVSLAVTAAAVARTLPESVRSVQPDARSFTPTSFKLPIMKISIAKLDGTMEQIVYQCPHSTEAQCLVDMASQTELDALAALARTVTVEAGTYDQVMLNTCVAGSSGETATTAKLTGSGMGPNGAIWTTNATTGLVTDGSGTAAEVDVGNWSCSTKSVIVSGGITVGATPLTLTVVVDNYMGAVFNENTSGGMGGCQVAGGGASGPGFCMTYPALMAYVGTDTPSTRRFTIAHHATVAPSVSTAANALIIVAVDGSGTPLMAYGRTLFTATSEMVAANTYASSILASSYDLSLGGPTYVTETNASTFTVNADGTISFSQGGSADTFAAQFAAFNATATHTGTVTSLDGIYSWRYLATLLP